MTNARLYRHARWSDESANEKYFKAISTDSEIQMFRYYLEKEKEGSEHLRILQLELQLQRAEYRAKIAEDCSEKTKIELNSRLVELGNLQKQLSDRTNVSVVCCIIQPIIFFRFSFLTKTLVFLKFLSSIFLIFYFVISWIFYIFLIIFFLFMIFLFFFVISFVMF